MAKLSETQTELALDIWNNIGENNKQAIELFKGLLTLNQEGYIRPSNLRRGN